MKTLHQKTALITGASSGIGRATALLFAQHGAHIIATARNPQALETLVTEIQQQGGNAIACPGNIQDETFAQHLIERAHAQFGGLDIAFNNAGTLGTLSPATHLTLAEWHHTLNTNLTSAFLGAKYQIPALQARGGGSLIFTSSFVGHTIGFPGMAAYAASKAGLIGLTQALAVELAPHNIRVNALLPGGTNTPMGQSVANTPEALAAIQNLHALKRLATPEEIAHSALYLASDASSFTTGIALQVDGGISIHRT